MRPVLRPVLEADLPALYRAESATEVFADWRFRGLNLPPVQFGMLNVRRVLRNHLLIGDRPMGVVALHSHSPVDEVAELACVNLSAATPVFGAAVALVLDEGFDLGLRQVSASVAEFNLAPIAPILGAFFEREAIERDAVFHRARHWDLHGFVLRRDRWTAEVRPWLARARTLLDVRPAGHTGPGGPGPTRVERGEP